MLTLKPDTGYYFAEALALTQDGATQTAADFYKITKVTTELKDGSLIVTVTHAATANS